jgi:hypothetical protein
VLRGDFTRALAEFWADGPESETPPGHWNVIANTVSDAAGFEHRIGGEGAALDRLEWDIKLYFALNGAVHDAAVAAWGLKGHYDSVRPISMIRYLGGKGQSTDPSLPSYDPDGLPLEPGVVELVTAETAAPGGRHERLAGHVGEVAVRSWLGSPEDPRTQTSGVGWVRAVDWVPYQRATFVTPAFAGFVSGTARSAGLRRGADGVHRECVLSRWHGVLHREGGFADPRARADEGRDAQWATFSTQPTRRASHGSTGASTYADDLEGRKIGAECAGGVDPGAAPLRQDGRRLTCRRRTGRAELARARPSPSRARPRAAAEATCAPPPRRSTR